MPAQVKDLKKGDLFRVQHEGKDGLTEFSPWQVALEDANHDEATGNVSVQSDGVHIIMGRPEIVHLHMRHDGMTRTPVSPEPVPERKVEPDSNPEKH